MYLWILKVGKLYLHIAKETQMDTSNDLKYKLKKCWFTSIMVWPYARTALFVIAQLLIQPYPLQVLFVFFKKISYFSKITLHITFVASS